MFIGIFFLCPPVTKGKVRCSHQSWDPPGAGASMGSGSSLTFSRFYSSSYLLSLLSNLSSSFLWDYSPAHKQEWLSFIFNSFFGSLIPLYYSFFYIPSQLTVSKRLVCILFSTVSPLITFQNSQIASLPLSVHQNFSYQGYQEFPCCQEQWMICVLVLFSLSVALDPGDYFLFWCYPTGFRPTSDICDNFFSASL